MRVLKFPFPCIPRPEHGGVSVTLPRGAHVLHVGVQYGTPFLWVLADPAEPVSVQRDFVVLSTGDILEALPRHVTTLSLIHGSVVLHVFEVTP